MEKVILKTLIYADIFEYPLSIYEIHKWLIGRKAGLRQIVKALVSLTQKSKVKSNSYFYFLPKRDGLVSKRKFRTKQSLIYIRKVTFMAKLFKVIPWIKLVGVSGGLAMDNADKYDDIDLFIITSLNRLWLSRFLILGILSILGQRRRPSDSKREAAGKICCNTLIDEDNLEQTRKDIYTAHEVLQMKVLWERDGIYQKYLEANSWTFRYLPNWLGNSDQVVSSKYYVLRKKEKNTHNTYYIILNTISNIFEILAKKFQLYIMQEPKGMERIQDGALYFHPNDIRQKILKEYSARIKTIP